MRPKLRVSIAAIALLAASAFGARAAGARSGDESEFLAKVNAERTSRGLAGLSWSEDLARVARNHSKRMADNDRLYHNPNLANEVSGWQELGENVGVGSSVPELHDAFMASSVHRDAILHRPFTQIGIGTVWRDGTLWVTEVFMKPMPSQQTYRSAKTARPAASRRTGGRTARTPAAPAAAPAVAVRPPVRQAEEVGDLRRIMVAKMLAAQEAAGPVVREARALSPASLAGSVLRTLPAFIPLED